MQGSKARSRIARLDEEGTFKNLAVSKKKDPGAKAAEEAEGRGEQEAIRRMLGTLPATVLKDRGAFLRSQIRACTPLNPCDIILLSCSQERRRLGMPQLLVRNLDEKTIERLKASAKRRGRSLQGHVKAVLEEAAAFPPGEVSSVVRKWQAKFAGKRFSDSAKLIREDRQR